MYLPIGLFGVSIATAALPDLSRQAAATDKDAMRRTISSGLRMMLMLNVPATIGLIALARPIIEFLLQRGAFTSHDTAGTAAALMFYAPGLVGYSAVKIASPSFYALGDSRTPVIASILSVGLNLGLNLMLVRVMGYQGLALGTATAALFNAGLLLFLLRRRLDGLDERRLGLALMKIVIASALMGGVAALTSDALTVMLPGAGLLAKALRVFSAIAVGVLVLAGSARLLGIAEFNDAANRVLQRLSQR